MLPPCPPPNDVPARDIRTLYLHMYTLRFNARILTSFSVRLINQYSLLLSLAIIAKFILLYVMFGIHRLASLIKGTQYQK